MESAVSSIMKGMLVLKCVTVVQHPASGANSPGVKRPIVKLTTHYHLVPMSRMVELYPHPFICLHDIVLN
jgi:hypothetical protein